jgi:acyl-CoA hydrolase
MLPNRVVASLCMGTEKLYRYVDNNPHVLFPLVGIRQRSHRHRPQRQPDFHQFSALEVDLTGQVCTDSMGYMFYSGIGDQVDFLRGSAMSKGGFSVIALPSTAQNGKSRESFPILSEGAGVATTRGDVNFVVTEYGIAELREKAFTSGSWNWPRSPTPNSGKNSSTSPKPGTTFFRSTAALPGRP